MVVRGLGLLIVLAMALVAALLVLPDQADALGVQCPESGIVPDSAFIVSSSNQAGEMAGHVVWFQLCQPTRVAKDGEVVTPRITRIALLWQDGLGRGFFLDNRKTAGITLRTFGGAKSWNVTSEYVGYECSVGASGEGIAIDFTQDIFSADIPASKASPLTLQFEIPAGAGMFNPLKQGKYSWAIVVFYENGSHRSTYAEKFNSPMLEVASGEIHLSETSGGPGTSVLLSGSGFKPRSTVQSIEIDRVEIKPPSEVSTDGEGGLDLDVIIPGVDIGQYPFLVQIDGITVYTSFTVTGSMSTYSIFHVERGVEHLGDNFEALFHYNSDICQWSFYDPDIPESDLEFLITGEHYWILVKEPVEIVLNRKLRNLTCTPEGNCWNQIVW